MDLPRGTCSCSEWPAGVKQPTLRRSGHAISFLLSKPMDKISQCFPVLAGQTAGRVKTCWTTVFKQ